MITYGSVCSGIEAASVAWGPLGMRPAWFSEIEPFPCALLRHYWPRVANVGDMTAVPAMVRCGLIPAPDVLVGGTPCQAFSVAGLRGGLTDARGQLTLTYVGILNAIDEQRPGREAVCLWENVPGVLTSKDNAFGCFLAALCGESAELKPAGGGWTNSGAVFGPRRAVAWRTLDAQHFGLAQRRRRVFVVASARGGFDPCQVLFEQESVHGGTPQSREAQAGAAPGSPRCATSGGGPDIVGALDSECGFSRATFQSLAAGHVVAGTLTARGLNALGARDVEEGVLQATYCGRARKLTPEECEKLQGFPRGHTRVPYRGRAAEDCPDGPRYKAIGNSKAVPVVKWVGARILKELGL